MTTVMATQERILPSENKEFTIWSAVTRSLQALLAIIVLGIDIFVIEEWNKNGFSFNSAPGLDLKTWVGGTPFTGIVMFTVSHPVIWTSDTKRHISKAFGGDGSDFESQRQHWLILG